MKFDEMKQRLDPKCWTGKKIGNPKTKVKGGVRVNNCVPKEGVAEGLPKAQDGRYNPDGSKKQAWHKDPRWQQHAKDLENDPKNIYSGVGKKKVKEQGVAEGEIEKTPTGMIHRARKQEPSRAPEPERLHKSHVSDFDKSLGIKWDKSPGRGRHGIVDPDVNEEYNPEYDDEAGMAQGSLHTLQNAVAGLQDVIDAGDNLPEWCQEKISLAEDYLVTVWDYIQSEKAQGIDPEIEEMYEAMEELAEEMAAKKGVSADLVWETFEAMDDNMLYETAAWRRKEGKSKTGGLNAKGVASYRRENPGSKLQTAVTTKPSKLKKGSKAAKRRKSFCARMSGVKGPMKKPNGKPTRKALALRKWNC